MRKYKMPDITSAEGTVIFCEPVARYHVEGLPDTYNMQVSVGEGITIPLTTLEAIPVGTRVRCDNIHHKCVRITRLA